MKNSATLYSLKDTIARLTGLTPEEIGNDDSLVQDIGLSSFETMLMLRELEKTFQVSITMQDLRQIVTVRELANLVLQRQK